MAITPFSISTTAFTKSPNRKEAISRNRSRVIGPSTKTISTSTIPRLYPTRSAFLILHPPSLSPAISSSLWLACPVANSVLILGNPIFMSSCLPVAGRGQGRHLSGPKATLWGRRLIQITRSGSHHHSSDRVFFSYLVANFSLDARVDQGYTGLGLGGFPLLANLVISGGLKWAKIKSLCLGISWEIRAGE